MDLLCEKLENTNAFQLDILIPLTKIVSVYLEKAPKLNPVEFCILLFAREVKTYSHHCNPDNDFLDDSIEDLKNLEIPEHSTQNVIVDLFMNIIRFKTVLEAVRDDFIKERRYRHDVNSQELLVLIYVLIHRLPQSSFDHSLDCFVYYKIPRMLSLVSYILRPETLNLAYATGILFFEGNFVEERIVWPFVDAIPRLEGLRLFLREEKKKLEPPRKDVTVPMFMGVLNHPKKLPRLPPPTPAELTVKRFARNVPRSVYMKPTTEEKLASIHEENKIQAMNLLNAANKSAPKCWQRRVKDPAEVADAVEKQQEGIRTRKPPTFSKSVVVKQTAASILRECARIIKDETKEVNKLKELVEGGQDPASILKAEEKRRQQEKEEEVKRMQEKFLSALLTREAVFTAKETLLSDMKLRAENVRKERQELFGKLEKWRENHYKEMTEVVVKCREIEQASRNAFAAMTDEKRRKGAEVSEESRQLKLSLAKQREEEMQRKIQLIQEIKTIQSLKSLPKDFDPTESSGLGLLCEMSLAELREKLFWTKLKLNVEVEERKSNIRQDRERQKCLMEETRKAVEEYKANKASNRRSSSSSRLEQRAICVTSPEILAVRRKLLERRNARLRK